MSGSPRDKRRHATHASGARAAADRGTPPGTGYPTDQSADRAPLVVTLLSAGGAATPTYVRDMMRGSGWAAPPVRPARRSLHARLRHRVKATLSPMARSTR